MGKDKGFRCERCGARFSGIGKVEFAMERELKPGLYVTSTRSQRHLTKPLVRYGQENQFTSEGMIEEWHFPRDIGSCCKQ